MLNAVGPSEFEDPGRVPAGEPMLSSCMPSNEAGVIGILLHRPLDDLDIELPGLPVLVRYEDAGVGVRELLLMLPSELFMLFMLRRASLLNSPFKAAPMAP